MTCPECMGSGFDSYSLCSQCDGDGTVCGGCNNSMDECTCDPIEEDRYDAPVRS